MEENGELKSVLLVHNCFHSVLPLVVTAQALDDRWLIVSLL